MGRYQLRNTKVMDGDTVRADILLGFDVTLNKKSIRMAGINAPETHTRNLLEKKAGKLITKWLSARIKGLTLELVTDSDDEEGKFGRPLGTLLANDVDICAEMEALGYIHRYEGGTKVPFAEDELYSIINNLEV